MAREVLLQYKKKIRAQEKQIKDGYNRMRSEVNELRRGYKKTADFCWRSGSGRIIAGYFNTLRETWGGGPAVTLLPSAVFSQKTSYDKEESDSPSETEELEQQPEKRDQNKIEEQTKTEEQTKIGVNNVQKLRDFKRNHMVKKYLYRKETWFY